MDIKEVRESIKKFWDWLWNSDSWLSYIVFIALLFVFIKLIFFPILSALLGTQLPLAIVESCSMYHQGDLFSDYETWWQSEGSKYSDYNIQKEDFDEFKFKKGFNKGDILIMVRANPDTLKVGEVILFNADRKNPVIHRIVKIEELLDGKKIFSTLGDNNNGQLEVEKAITEEQLVGKAYVRAVPFIGWLKLIFFEGSKSEADRGTCSQN